MSLLPLIFLILFPACLKLIFFYKYGVYFIGVFFKESSGFETSSKNNTMKKKSILFIFMEIVMKKVECGFKELSLQL